MRSLAGSPGAGHYWSRGVRFPISEAALNSLTQTKSTGPEFLEQISHLEHEAVSAQPLSHTLTLLPTVSLSRSVSPTVSHTRSISPSLSHTLCLTHSLSPTLSHIHALSPTHSLSHTRTHYLGSERSGRASLEVRVRGRGRRGYRALRLPLGPGKTLHPQPYTLSPTPSTLRPQPYALNPMPSTLHPQPYTLNPTPSTLHPAPYTLNPTPSTLTQNFKP